MLFSFIPVSAKLGTNTRNSKKSKGQQVSVMWLQFLRWNWLNRDLKNKTWACTPPGLIYAGVFSFVESSRTTWSPPFSSLAYSWARRGDVVVQGKEEGHAPPTPHCPTILSSQWGLSGLPRQPGCQKEWWKATCCSGALAQRLPDSLLL